jgi:hypothetical protein
MRIIRKSGENKKNVVPCQYRNAASSFSQQFLRNNSHLSSTFSVSGLQISGPNLNTTNITEANGFSLRLKSSGSTFITVSCKRHSEKLADIGLAIRYGIGQEEFLKYCAAGRQSCFSGKFIHGSAIIISVSVKHNLGWLYHGTKKSYFQAATEINGLNN